MCPSCNLQRGVKLTVIIASLALAEREVSYFMTLVSMYGIDFTRAFRASRPESSGTPAGMAAVDARICFALLCFAFVAFLSEYHTWSSYDARIPLGGYAPTEVSVEDFLSQLHLSVSAGCCTCTLREVMGTALSQQSLD